MATLEVAAPTATEVVAERKAAGEVADEPAMMPGGEKLDANRHATNGGSRRGTAWSSNGAGGNRGCVCERFLGFMEGMMMSVGGGGGGGGRAISKQIRGALSHNDQSQPPSSAAPV